MHNKHSMVASPLFLYLYRGKRFLILTICNLVVLYFLLNDQSHSNRSLIAWFPIGFSLEKSRTWGRRVGSAGSADGSWSDIRGWAAGLFGHELSALPVGHQHFQQQFKRQANRSVSYPGSWDIVEALGCCPKAKHAVSCRNALYPLWLCMILWQMIIILLLYDLTCKMLWQAKSDLAGFEEKKK